MSLRSRSAQATSLVFSAIYLRSVCGRLLESTTVPQVEFSWIYRNPLATKITVNANATAGVLQYSHMSMLAALPDGTLAAAWQGADVFYEGSALQNIYWATSKDHGHTWSQPSALVTAQGLPLWGPVLHVQDETIWLIYAVSKPACWWIGEGGRHWACGGTIMVQHSRDYGATWSQAEEVYTYEAEGGIAKMVANKLVVNAQGDWVLPFWREMGGQAVCNQHPELHGSAGVLVSKDMGESWRVHNVTRDAVAPDTWLIEGTLAKMGSNQGADSLIQMFRTEVGVIYASTSRDGGNSWTPAMPTSLRNPNSKVALASLGDGRVVLAFNDDGGVERTPLVLAVSRDGALPYRAFATLESASGDSFHYPTILYLPEQERILVSYSYDVGSPSASRIAPVCRTCGRGVGGRVGVEAWGKVNYGIKLAMLNVSDVAF